MQAQHVESHLDVDSLVVRKAFAMTVTIVFRASGIEILKPAGQLLIKPLLVFINEFLLSTSREHKVFSLEKVETSQNVS